MNLNADHPMHEISTSARAAPGRPRVVVAGVALVIGLPLLLTGVARAQERGAPVPISSAADGKRSFNLPAGSAERTLKLFSEQSGRALLTATTVVQGVRTNTVQGELTAREALDRMLAGTGLISAQDEKNGAFTVRRESPDPNGPRAAQKTASDRPSRPSAAPIRHQGSPGTGTIVGRVFNPATGEYVRNAEVRVQGMDRIFHTDNSGEFRVPEVPAEQAVVSVHYTGYQPAIVSIAVSAGETASREINLVSSSYGGAKTPDGAIKLQEFVVSGDREGNAKAIMEQRNNMNISRSVASDVFGDVLDGNVGEFIKYLPGVDVEITETRAYLPRLGGLEPNFTGVAIDGVRVANADSQLAFANVENSAGVGEYARATGFDGVSLNSIEAIEINTTLSPDMDADAPAGQINMKTKRAFDIKGRRITYQLGATLNSQEFTLKKRWGPLGRERLARPNAMVGYSESFFGNRFGMMFNLGQSRTYDEYRRSSTVYNRTPVGADQRPLVITQVQFKDGPNLAQRLGGTFTADFKATPELTLGLNVAFNNYQHEQDASNTLLFNLAANGTAAATGRQNVLGDGLTSLRTNGLATNTGRNVNVGSAPVFKETRNVAYAPKFEYRHGRLKLNGTYSYSHGNSVYLAKERGHLGVTIAALGGVDFTATRPDPTSPEWTITQVGGLDWSNLANFRGNTTVAGFGRTALIDAHDGQLDAQYTLPGRIPSFVKFGGKFNEEGRKTTQTTAYEAWNYIGPGGGPGGNWGEFRSGNEIDLAVRSSNWLHIANMPPRRDTAAVGTLFREHPEYFVRSATADNYYSAFVANTRDFLQRIAAAYGMANARVGLVQLQGGVRWERTTTYSREFDPRPAAEVQAAGFAVNATTRRATTIPGIDYQFFSQPRVTRESEYDKWFPSVSAKLNITRDFQAHIGYNRAISRPAINALSGVWVVDDLNGRVNAPNPALKPADADKIVARLAYYFEPVGSFTLQVSQNDITNLRTTHSYPADAFGYGSDPDWSTYEFISTTNDPFERRLRSLEVGYNQALSFLPGVLRGLNVNLAYTRNYANVHRPGVSPRQVSANLGWAWRRYTLRVGSVWTAETPWSGEDSAWLEPLIKFDLGGSLRLSRYASLFFQGRNITNASRIVYASQTDRRGEAPYLVHARNFGAAWLFGVKGTF